MENLPSPSVATVADGRPRRDRITLAWGMTAPVGSATVPAMLPGESGLTSCARDGASTPARIPQRTTSLEILVGNENARIRVPKLLP